MTTEFAFFDKYGNYLLGCSGKDFMIIFWQNCSETFKKTLIPKLKIDGLSENWQAWDIEEEIRQMKEDKRKERIMLVNPKTVEWSCSGCNIYCTLLTDITMNPNNDLVCKKGTPNWRDQDEIDKLKRGK